MRDRVEGGYRLGSTAAFAALTARRLGLRCAVLTCFGPEIDPSPLLPGVDIVNTGAPVTTTFQNVYTPSGRVQYLPANAPPIPRAALPAAWRHAPVVLLGPLDQEVDAGMVEDFPRAVIGISPQGWMRRWDDSRRVWPVVWDGAGALDRAHVMSLSEDDLPERALPPAWRGRPEALALTRGPKGSWLRYHGRWHAVPPYPAREVDPTGAGDVFAAAYLVRYHETKDPLAAALFASCVASFAVEAPGLDGIPNRTQVEARMEACPGLRVLPARGTDAWPEE